MHADTDELALLRAENARIGAEIAAQRAENARIENARLRIENARLRADLLTSQQAIGLNLLYAIREACGLNRYVDLSDLPDHVRRMRASLLELTDAGRSIWGPFEAERAIQRARDIARGTGNVSQAAE